MPLPSVNLCFLTETILSFDHDGQVAEMMNFGLSREVCEAALAKQKDNLEVAVNYVFDLQAQPDGEEKLAALVAKLTDDKLKQWEQLKQMYARDWCRTAMYFR